MFGRDFEAGVSSRFVFELVIWPNRLLRKDELNPRVRCAFGNVLLFSQNQICGPLYTTCRENQRHITKPLIQIFKLKFLVPFCIVSALCIHFLCITTNVCLLKSKRDLQFMIVLSFKNCTLPIFICFSKAVMRYC